MYQFLNKYGQLSAFGLGLLIVAIYFIQVYLGLDTFNSLSKEAQLETGIFNFGLTATLALAALCIVIIFSFGIVYLISNPRLVLRAILPFLVVAVLAILLFFLSKPASSGPMMDLAVKFELTPNIEKFVSAGLWTTIIMFLVALLSLAAMEVRNFFK